VWEVAGEFDLPLLKDVPFFKSLNINGAARYTRYNVSGDYVTWKIGADWHLNDWMSLRATRSRDIRAPTLFDLYAPLSIVQVRALDLYTNTTPTVPNPNYSNPNLTAEIGNTLTGGVVLKPFRGFSLAVDGYKIKITDAITQINGQTAEIQLACYASGGTSPYCALQSRPQGLNGNTTAANQATSWSARYLNISNVETWGIDVEANYAGTLFDRPMSIRLLAAYQPELVFRQPGLADIDQAGVAFGALGFSATPTVRLTGYVHVEPVEGISMDVMERWRNAMKIGADGTGVIKDNHIAPFATTSLNLAFNVPGSKGRYQFYANVQNLFNATPPIAAYVGNGSRAGLRDGFVLGDDPRGRYYTAGVRLKF
jgi:iron complex outermembrane receptor protein